MKQFAQSHHESSFSRPSRRTRIWLRDRLNFEHLEARLLLSVNPFPDLDSGSGPTWGPPENPEELGLVEIQWQGRPSYFQPGHWILRMEETDSGPRVLDQLQVQIDTLAGQDTIRTIEALGINGAYQVQTGPDVGYTTFLETLQGLRGFRYLEPDFYIWANQTLPDDPRFGDLWGLHNIGQNDGTADADIDAPEVWERHTGSGDMVVGVIDTGVLYTHEDLIDNIWTNPNEIPNNGIDDDDNGYVDDIHGWDFANNDNDPADDHGHGTHVSGTIAGAGNNGIGITGVNWNAQIMGLKFLTDSGGGTLTDAIDAISYATMMRKDFGVNIRLTNNSWGGGGFSQTLHDAIAESAANDMLFIAASGNEGADLDEFPSFPASYELDNIISVAATDRNDLLADFSNIGGTSVDVAAPGVDIWSSVPGGYLEADGTSMAAPHVSGIVALVWDENPNSSYQEVRDAILDTVEPLDSLNGKVATGGRVNAMATLLEFGLLVVSSTPERGAVLGTRPTAFTIGVSDPYDPLTVDASDLTVNGTPADRVDLVDADTLQFHFETSPVTQQGLQTIAIAEEAFYKSGPLPDPVKDWTAAFRYDAVFLDISGTVPVIDSIQQLPLTEIRLDWNEPIESSSVDISDLNLSQGFVSEAEVLHSRSVRYQIQGIEQEGILQVEMPSGAITDRYGNPQVAILFETLLDVDSRPARDFDEVAPGGSLVFLSEDRTGFLHGASDQDVIEVYLEGGQTLAAVVTPVQSSATLSIAVEDFQEPVTAVSPGQPVSSGVFSITGGKHYAIRVSGDQQTAFKLQLYRNTSVEVVDSNPIHASSMTDSETVVVGGRFAAVGLSEPEKLDTLVVFTENFDSGLGDFTLDNSFGSGNGLWHLSSGRSQDNLDGHTPPQNLYYGKDETSKGDGNYDQPPANGGAAYSPVITIPEDSYVTLGFQYFLETEDFPGYDVAQLAVDAGHGFVPLLSSSGKGMPTGTGGKWVGVTADLSPYTGKDIQFQFSFETLDNLYNNYEGWYVDDILITAVPLLPDEDRYEVDLTGWAGKSIDIALSVDSSYRFQPPALELWNAADSQLLESAEADARDGLTRLYDRGIHGFVVPEDGIYSVHVNSIIESTYSLVINASMLFESESLDPTQPLNQSLDLSAGAIGYLDGPAQLLFAVEASKSVLPIIHTIDPLTGTILNSYNAPGNTTSYEPALNLAFDGTSLWYNAGPLLGSGDPTVYQLDPLDGSYIRSFVPEEVYNSVTGLGYTDGELFVVDFDDWNFAVENIDVYDTDDLGYMRSMNVAPDVAFTGLTGDDSRNALYAVDQFSNTIYQMHPENGSIMNQWSSGVMGEQGLAILGNELFIAAAGVSVVPETEIVVLDLETREELRRFQMPFELIAGLGGDGASAAAIPSDAAALTKDSYQLTLEENETITLRTEIPYSHSRSTPVTGLDPRLVLRDPAGTVVASDEQSMPDSRNARIQYTAETSGVHTLDILGNDVAGTYLIHLDRCSSAFTGGILDITCGTGGSTVILSADDSGIMTLNGQPISGAPTTTSVDSISIQTGPGNDLVVIDQSQHAFGPGLTSESSGESDIEISLDMGSGYDRVQIIGGSVTNDTFTITGGAINLNGDNDGEVSVAGVESISLSGGGGDDTMSFKGWTTQDTADMGILHLLLDGGSGNDVLRNHVLENVTIQGGSGNDSIFGGKVAEWIEGQDGADTISGYGKSDTVFGGDGNDVIRLGHQTLSTSENGGWVDGGAGNDTILGYNGADTLFGGEGNDVIRARPGRDRVYGGPGDDLLNGGNHDDTLRGGSGNDTLQGKSGNDAIYGESGEDKLVNGPVDTGDDTLDGGQGTDLLRVRGQRFEETFALNWQTTDVGNTADPEDDVTGHLRINHFRDETTPLESETVRDVEQVYVYGFGGADLLDFSALSITDLSVALIQDLRGFGGGGRDTLLGSYGPDYLSGDGARDELFGGDGNDTLDGGNGNDTLKGQAGDDLLWILGSGSKYAEGGTGNDILDARDSNSIGHTLTGGAGDDVLYGGDGSDLIRGGSGDDLLLGAEGDDELDGGQGIDTLDGGLGTDTAIDGEDVTDCEQ